MTRQSTTVTTPYRTEWPLAEFPFELAAKAYAAMGWKWATYTGQRPDGVPTAEEIRGRIDDTERALTQGGYRFVVSGGLHVSRRAGVVRVAVADSIARAMGEIGT